MNVYDSMRIERLLESEYESVDSTSLADLIIINTCSVRKKPEEKLLAVLSSLSPLKKQNKDLIIGVGGCVAQQYGEELFKEAPCVDFVFGTHNLSLIPTFIKDVKKRSKHDVSCCDISYRERWEELPLTLPPFKGDLSFSIAISRGCNNRCAYCIVPQTRGSEVSRPTSQILDEIEKSVACGAKEVLLLGQCVNSYGSDLEDNVTFEKLLQMISEVDGLERIRFVSPHPKHITDEFISLVCSNPKICRHVHLPLQAGNNRVLSLMNRGYSREHYLNLIEKIKSKVPDMAFTTDIIVGFPTETEQEFLETVDIINQVGFTNSYSFVYSPRPNTEALKLSDMISYEEKLERLKFLQEKQYEVSSRVLKSFVGKNSEILIDGFSKKDKDCFKGTNSQNITVNFSLDWSKKNSDLKLGDIVNVKISDSARLTLKA